MNNNLASELDPRLAAYFTEYRGGCPYGLQDEAVFHQAVLCAVPEDIFGYLLAQGYRRHGNCFYDMRCEGCKRCVSIRLQPERVRLNRIQRRVLKKNTDVQLRIAPISIASQSLQLLNKFLRIRYPEGRERASSYYHQFFLSSHRCCFEFSYWLGPTLVGVAIIDFSPSWMNAVYFFFDPDYAARSLGVLNILRLQQFCLAHQIPLLYLGYCIEELSAMSYKNRFKPHQLLLDNCWREQPAA